MVLLHVLCFTFLYDRKLKQEINLKLTLNLMTRVLLTHFGLLVVYKYKMIYYFQILKKKKIADFTGFRFYKNCFNN